GHARCAEGGVCVRAGARGGALGGVARRHAGCGREERQPVGPRLALGRAGHGRREGVRRGRGRRRRARRAARGRGRQSRLAGLQRRPGGEGRRGHRDAGLEPADLQEGHECQRPAPHQAQLRPVRSTYRLRRRRDGVGVLHERQGGPGERARWPLHPACSAECVAGPGPRRQGADGAEGEPAGM
ncbi:unnamed protein product, partial [Prorocentrum cordatum]